MRLIELTEGEHRAVMAARAAHEIVGGDPLVPYDITGLAREVVRLREQASGAVDRIAALKPRDAPEGDREAVMWTAGYRAAVRDALATFGGQ